MVGEKGLEPSPLTRRVPKTRVSTVPPLAQLKNLVSYILLNLIVQRQLLINHKVKKETYTYKNENGIFFEKKQKK